MRVFRLILLSIAFSIACAPLAWSQEVCSIDPDGVENGGQSDISQICFEADPLAPTLSISWDTTSAWNGGNSGDACAMFDTDNDGNSNLAFCVSIVGNASGVPTMDTQYPRIFPCNDAEPDKCRVPKGQSDFMSIAVCTVSVTQTDPFPAPGGANAPDDLTVDCALDPVEIPVSPITASSFNSSNPSSNPVDSFVYDPVAAPSLTITKTPTPTTYNATGETITYDYVVSNTGNTVMTTITVDDDKTSVSCGALGGGLYPNQSVDCTASYTIVSADVTNTSVTNIAFATDGSTSSPTVSATVTYTGTGGTASLTANKTVVSWDPTNVGIYSIPGADVLYSINITNTGTGVVDTDSLLLIDAFPDELSFYNGDLDGAGNPVIFTEIDSGLMFNPTTDIAYVTVGNPVPISFADCGDAPTGTYDPNIKYICFNPKGTMAFGSPIPEMTISFRAQIQ